MAELVLLFAALMGRLVGASARQSMDCPPARAVGWLTCMSANWLAAGALGAWFPLWPVLAVGVLGVLVETPQRRLALWLVGDLLAVVLCGSFSIPPVPPVRLTLIVLGVCVAGFLLDALAMRVRPPLRQAALGVAAFGWVLVLAAMVQGALHADDMSTWRSARDLVSPRMSVGAARLPGTERLVLDTGAIAWLDRPSGAGPFPGALFFHGANSRASHQPSAIIARRALVDAGFVVLAVDHPGYGDSPSPALDAAIEAWDPMPTTQAAYRALDGRPDVGWILAAGHSMGTSDVLRLLATDADVAAAVLFGAATSAPLTPHWYRKFHTDRHLEEGSIPLEKWREIRRLSDRVRLAEALPDADVPILYAIHGFEPPHARHEREMLYQLLPEPKELWPLATATHQFSTAQVAGVVVGDTSVGTNLSLGLRRFARQLLEQRPMLSQSGADRS